MLLRLSLPALALLLAGCDPSFNVDFVATPLADTTAAVTLRLEGVDLRKTDGTTVTLTRNSTGEFRVQGLTQPVAAELLSKSNIDGGEYDRLRLRLADDPGTVARTAQTTEDIEAGTATGDDTAVAFDINADKSGTTSLLVALDTVLSLSEKTDGTGFTLDPVIRAMDNGDAARVSGSIPTSRFADAACSTGTRLVYAFVGTGVTADERDGVGVEPIATAPIERSVAGGPGSYVLDFMPPGEYTLAFTCEGQFENGRLHSDDEAIDFFDGPDVTLEPGDNVRVDFDA